MVEKERVVLASKVIAQTLAGLVVVASDLLCVICVIVPTSPLFLHLLNHLYLNPRVLLLLFFPVSPHSCWEEGRGE